jgi:hypothetical protein
VLVATWIASGTKVSTRGEMLRGVKSRTELAGSSSWEVEVRLEQAGSELAKERDTTKGPPPFLFFTS